AVIARRGAQLAGIDARRAAGIHRIGDAVAVVVHAVVARGRAEFAHVGRIGAASVTGAIGAEVAAGVTVVVEAIVAGHGAALAGVVRPGAAGIATRGAEV